jgi:protein tyrosine phosphatase (PTP) superfamily phosphohydrolase (DUF442 family)
MGTAILTPDRPLPGTYWVIPGRLLGGEYPIGGDYTDARARLARFRESGFNHFIDLTEEGEMPGYRHLLPVSARYQRSAIPDTQVPVAAAQVQQILRDIRASLTLSRPVYVHCRAGIGRTGLIMGCYLAEEGGGGKRALAELNRLWKQSERAKAWPEVPQTRQQANYIRDWLKTPDADAAHKTGSRTPRQ